MLLRHWLRRAASRAACTAGSKSEIKTAMMAITTKSSIKVKPFRLLVICSSFQNQDKENVNSLARDFGPLSRSDCRRLAETEIKNRSPST
jgi:hypothetical protein